MREHRKTPAVKLVLLIEGDEVVSRSLTLMLEAERFVVESVNLGASGIRCALSGAYDLIIVSPDLADMSGLEVMAQLRAANVLAPVQFVSVTPATATSPATLHLSPSICGSANS